MGFTLIIKEPYTQLIGKEILLLRMGGELGIKSRKTRRRMVNTLKKNLRILLKNNQIGNSLFEYRDRLILLSDKKESYEKIALLLSSQVSGISSVSIATVVISTEEAIIERGVSEAQKTIPPNSTYAVRARREGKHLFTSMSIAANLGGAIHSSGIDGLKVDLSTPDYTIFLDIRDELTFIYSKIIRGIDGLPTSVQGAAIAIFRPNMNSILAAWVMNKRGVNIIPVFFQTGKNSEVSYITLIENLFSPIHSFIDLNNFLNTFKDESNLCFYCQAYCETIAQEKAKQDGILTFISSTCFNFNNEDITILGLKMLEKRVDLHSLRPIQFGFLGEEPTISFPDTQACCPLRDKVFIEFNESFSESKIKSYYEENDR
jgi:thiamine biosynthesis protein ThiI